MMLFDNNGYINYKIVLVALLLSVIFVGALERIQ